MYYDNRVAWSQVSVRPRVSTGQCPGWVLGGRVGGWVDRASSEVEPPLDLLHHLNALQHMLLFPSPNNPFCFFFSFVFTLPRDLYKFKLQDKKVSNIYLPLVYKFSWLSPTSYSLLQKRTYPILCIETSEWDFFALLRSKYLLLLLLSDIG